MEQLDRVPSPDFDLEDWLENKPALEDWFQMCKPGDPVGDFLGNDFRKVILDRVSSLRN